MSDQIFGKYAEYYNLLYKNKDYAAEARYIHSLIQKFHPGAKTVLNLGCGTGNHDFELAMLGYKITGIDMSDEMLNAASSRLESIDDTIPHPSFYKSDIRSVRLGKTFDVVISLFHVMSYQATNDDFQAVINTVQEHLSTGGLFVFDCWYGPGVLSDLPVVRVKRCADENISFVRIAEPNVMPNENMVAVNYQILITNNLTGKVEEVKETHCMRYLFIPEVTQLLKGTALHVDAVYEWKTDKCPEISTWYACFVVKR